MAEVPCRFQTETDDELPFPQSPCPPPQVGTLLFVAGEKPQWRVVDVQMQWYRLPGKNYPVPQMWIVILRSESRKA